MKVNRNGKSALITPPEKRKIRENLPGAYQVMFDIAWYTGERWGAIVQLSVNDVYDDRLRVRDEITFKGVTRKRSAGKAASTRQVPVHPKLRSVLSEFHPPSSGYLFPSPENPQKPITIQSCDRALRESLSKARLSSKGISLHSTRRTFITNLSRSGVPLKELQKLTGHKSISALMEYIDVDPDQLKNSILLLE